MNHFTPFIASQRGSGGGERMVFGTVCIVLIFTAGALALHLAS